jgi:hypothetical protein
MGFELCHHSCMTQEAFLKRMGKDPSVVTCSLCDEQFHSSPVGPLQSMKYFEKHVRDKHPGAVVKYKEDGNQAATRTVR